MPRLVEAVHSYADSDSVIVAPDMGAAKLAERYAAPLDLTVAVIHKARISGSEVSVGKVTGDVRGLKPIIVDDMISTGGTQEAAIEALLEAGCKPALTVVASHGLFVGTAAKDLADASVERYVVTDSVPLPEGLELPLKIVGLAPLLADAIDRLHNERSLDELIEQI